MSFLGDMIIAKRQMDDEMSSLPRDAIYYRAEAMEDRFLLAATLVGPLSGSAGLIGQLQGDLFNEEVRDQVMTEETIINDVMVEVANFVDEFSQAKEMAASSGSRLNVLSSRIVDTFTPVAIELQKNLGDEALYAPELYVPDFDMVADMLVQVYINAASAGAAVLNATATMHDAHAAFVTALTDFMSQPEPDPVPPDYSDELDSLEALRLAAQESAEHLLNSIEPLAVAASAMKQEMMIEPDRKDLVFDVKLYRETYLKFGIKLAEIRVGEIAEEKSSVARVQSLLQMVLSAAQAAQNEATRDMAINLIKEVAEA